MEIEPGNVRAHSRLAKALVEAGKVLIHSLYISLSHTLSPSLSRSHSLHPSHTHSLHPPLSPALPFSRAFSLSVSLCFPLSIPLNTRIWKTVERGAGAPLARDPGGFRDDRGPPFLEPFVNELGGKLVRVFLLSLLMKLEGPCAVHSI